MFRSKPILLLFLCLFTCHAALGQKPQPANQRPEPTEKQTYKTVGDQALEIWIWKPADWKASDKRAAVVFYHGGGWSGGNPSAFSRQSAKLAERGLVALSVQYRLTSQPGVQIPDCVKDAKSAFRWVVSHAAELGIDPERIAAGGGSAGGHLAAALATLDAINEASDDMTIPTRPAALVLFNPALKLDFKRAIEVAKDRRESLLLISPYHHLEAGHPPTLICHGEEDTTVPLQSVQDYAVKVRELGGICEVAVTPGQVHAFFNKEPHVWDTLKQAESFLEKHGFIR